MFCKYQITPQRGIDFGPVTYNTTSKPKTFDIINTGEFAYDFALTNYGGEPPPAAGKKADAKDAKKGAAAGGALTIGQFTCTPASGRIEPGAKAVSGPLLQSQDFSPSSSTYSWCQYSSYYILLYSSIHSFAFCCFSGNLYCIQG